MKVPVAPNDGPRPRRPRQSALGVLVILLAASAIIRLGATASHALDAAIAEAEPGAPAICETDASIQAMLTDLKGREQKVQERESRIAVREQAVAVAAREAKTRIGALKEAEDKLAATIAQADQAAAKDVDKLVAVYERMKAKDAAALFAEMEPDFAAGFLAKMKPDAAAAVMAGLDPKTAYAISVFFAGRNAAAPKT
jgi:flagellar motility protein MotE (MotC chaperone)